jgi:hypothetical protein
MTGLIAPQQEIIRGRDMVLRARMRHDVCVGRAGWWS